MTLKKCLILESLRNFTACGSSRGHTARGKINVSERPRGAREQHHAHNDVLQEDLQGHEELHLKYWYQVKY
jgi:hypothetical protein